MVGESLWPDLGRDLIYLLTLIVIPGVATFGVWQPKVKKQFDISLAEAVFLVLLTGTGITGWTALVLAELGFFSLLNLAALAFGYSLIVSAIAIWSRRRLPSIPHFKLESLNLLLVPILILAAVLYLRPHEYLLGGRDHGIYVDTGIHIARTGGLVVDDPLLRSASPEARSALTRYYATDATSAWDHGLRLVGFYITDQSTGESIPHGFHLYPSYYAILYSIGGLDFALLTTPLLALGGLTGVYLASRRLFGPLVGLVAALVLTLNLGQLWYARTPSAEILLQYFFWGGMLSLILTLESKNLILGCISGAAFGMIHLAKLEPYYVPLGLLLFLLAQWLHRRWHRAYGVLIVTYVLFCLHALLHAFLVALPYTLNVLVGFVPSSLALAFKETALAASTPLDFWIRFLSAFSGWLIIAAAGVGIALFLLQRYGRAATSLVSRLWEKPTLWHVLGCLIVIGGAWYYTQSTIFPRENMWLIELGWYVGKVGLVLAIAGTCALITRDKGKGESALLLLTAGAISAFLQFGSATYPDHFWAFRRSIPVILPFTAIAGATVIRSLMPSERKLWHLALVPLILSGFWISETVQTQAGFTWLEENSGLTDQLEAFISRFPQESILLIESSDEGEQIAAPLLVLSDQTPFIIRPTALEYPALSQAVRDWVEERYVFWIGTDGAFVPEWPGIRLDYQGTWMITGYQAEIAVSRIPQHIGHWMYGLDIYHLSVSEDSSDQVTVLDLDDSTLETYGFYQEPPLLGLSSVRWTGNKAEIRAPAPLPPSQLSIRLAGWPLSPSGPEVAIYLNGEYVGRITAKPAFDTYTLDVATAIQGDELSLQLATSTWNPHLAGIGTDDRDLGVLVDWIRLVRED